jgi:hypothetical protein
MAQTMYAHMNKLIKKKKPFLLAPLAHTRNPRYSGSRDQENHSLKLPQANSSQDLASKNPITKEVLVAWLKV